MVTQDMYRREGQDRGARTTGVGDSTVERGVLAHSDRAHQRGCQLTRTPVGVQRPTCPLS